jgi:hypothetical protein
MEARTKSFMLAPEFSYLPGHDIALGRILPLNDDTNVPDAEEPLDVRMTVAEDRITKQLIRPFEFDSDVATTTSGNANADVSFFTGVGGGAKGGLENSASMKITTPLVTKTRFKPTPEEIAKLLATPVVSGTLHERSRPPLYLITGLLVANGATVEDKTGKKQGGGLHANADLTSIQVPINLGVGAERSKTTNQDSASTIEGDFILAYQLLRFRKRLFGGKVEQKVERKWALFDDTGSIKETISLHDYLEESDLEEL